MPLVAAVGEAREVVLMIFGGEEGAEVVIEPPGNAGRRGIFEVDNGVFVAGEFSLVEEGAGAVNEAVVFVIGARMDALLVEPAEERSRAGTVKTLVVIKDPDLQDGTAPATAGEETPVGNLLAYRDVAQCQAKE